MMIEKIRWDRDEASFILVALVFLWDRPLLNISRASFADVIGTSVTPYM